LGENFGLFLASDKNLNEKLFEKDKERFRAKIHPNEFNFFCRGAK
jgi:hypothetical protein